MSRLKSARRSYPRSVKFAEKHGWEVEKTRGNHLRWSKPGRSYVVSALTPSDVRADRENLSLLRRAERGQI